MLYDFHMHSSISLDSDAPMEYMIRQSIEKGLSGVCFTQHIDYYFPDDFEIHTVDYDKYKAEFAFNKELFKDEIELFFGIEAGLHKNSYDKIKKDIENNAFDYILASIHCVNRQTIANGDYYDSLPAKDLIREYLIETLENIRAFNNFNCLAHLGFVAKFAPAPGFEVEYTDFKDLLDEILRFLIENGKGLEVNTSGLRRSLKTMPAKEIIKRYLELGGEILTLASDAHDISGVAYGFDETLQMLKSLGVNRLAKFNSQQLEFYNI